MFTRERKLEEKRHFGWYAKRLAVILSLGYLTTFIILYGLTELIPAVSKALGWFTVVIGPATAVTDGILRLASDGECVSDWWNDHLMEAFGWALFTFLGWFEMFAIGFVAGGSMDFLIALKRRLGP